MQTIWSKFTLLALMCAQVLNAQTDCDIPSSYFVGEYEIQDIAATIGPPAGTSNFEPGIYTVTANGNTRTFQMSLFPNTISNDFTIALNLNCGIIQINDIDLNVTCDNEATVHFAPSSDEDSTTYNLDNDSAFIINYIEDSLGSCGGPFMSSFSMNKVCNAPETITFPNFTSSTIDMNWSDPNDTVNSDISYTIAYGNQGFSLGNGQTITDISGSSYTITDLEIDTMYDFYIWTACTDTNSSDILGPFSYGTFVNPTFEVDTNAVTCLCPDANIGDSGQVTINGQERTFTKRNRSQLLALIENDATDPEIGLTCTTAIQDMSSLFENETSFNQDISSWDVSNVTDMSYMFYTDFSIDPPYSSFNTDIGYWDVSNVTDMSHMFESAKVFNQFIGLWDVSNVTDMSYMFSQAVDYNQPLNNWDVSNVANMEYMFKMTNAIYWSFNEFNLALNNWDVSNVTNMSHMFERCNVFDQSLSNWDVSNVSDMSSMFFDARYFNQDISMWNVSNVTNMSEMFRIAVRFNQPLNTWDVSNVYTMKAMFESCNDFNQSLDSWNVSNVANMQYMFLGSESFNQPLNDWNVSSVNNMGSMFLGAVYNQPLDEWDVSNVISMTGMFAGGSLFNQPIGEWDVSSVQYMQSMFASSIFNQDISIWCVENFQNEPSGFSLNSPLQEDFKPNWGEACTLSLVDSKVTSFDIYPNPVKDRMSIEINTISDAITIDILDSLGRIISSQNADTDTKTTEIDLGFLSSGMYFIKVSTSHNVQIERFIKS